jgi:hypothetical protein
VGRSGADRVDYAVVTQITEDQPVTNRVSYAPQDFQKMCRQAEIDHETKRLVILLDRVKKQIADRDNGWSVESPKLPATAVSAPSSSVLPLVRSPFER